MLIFISSLVKHRTCGDSICLLLFTRLASSRDAQAGIGAPRRGAPPTAPRLTRRLCAPSSSSWAPRSRWRSVRPAWSRGPSALGSRARPSVGSPWSTGRSTWRPPRAWWTSWPSQGTWPCAERRPAAFRSVSIAW